MKFSIIIPVYNAVRFIKNCIDSCINQSYSNIEIICIDDFSTDNSREILEYYQNKDKKIKCIYHSKNESQYIARRSGFYKSTGDYILFLDSDDTLRRDACALISKKIKKTDADIIQFGYKEVPSGKIIFPPFFSSSKERICEYLARENRYSPQVWTKAYKYSTIKRAFGQMEEFYASGPEDLYSSIVFTHYAETFVLLKKPLVYYSFNTGWSRRKEYSLPIYTSWLSSYSTVIQKIYAFVSKNIPEFTNKCFDMELYMLKDFIYNRLPTDITPELKRQFFEILPLYFSKDVINEYIHEASFKSQKYDEYLNFNASFIAKSKKTLKYLLLYLNSFRKKHI